MIPHQAATGTPSVMRKPMNSPRKSSREEHHVDRAGDHDDAVDGGRHGPRDPQARREQGQPGRVDVQHRAADQAEHGDHRERHQEPGRERHRERADRVGRDVRRELRRRAREQQAEDQQHDRRQREPNVVQPTTPRADAERGR